MAMEREAKPIIVSMISATILVALSQLSSAPEKGALGKLFQRVRGCVFEVVVSKHHDSGATYAERLPTEDLSFQERNDSVWSIGSAFAVGKDTILTAAHVLELGRDDPFYQPRLRDDKGRVFAIGKLLKYSNHEDFALFTVPGLSVKQPLRPAKKLEVGKTVLAVGNALGEGIVLRDGLLTSQTPESENGEWKFWRFSAAASPGNSGGPLLDAQGGLVGVVLMKSESENLNYALPWSVVSGFKSGVGRYRERSSYSHPAMPDRERVSTMDTTFPLPSTWKELDHQNWILSGLKTARDRDSLLRQEASEFFPRGKSGKLRMIPILQVLPTTIVRGQDGWWVQNVRKSGDPVDLGSNGSWRSSSDEDLMRAAIELPDTTRLSDYVDGSRLLGDLLLKGGRLTRDFAGKEIRVTSLGKAVAESLRVDRWGRPWLVRAWRQPWDGALLVAHLLPQPAGFAALVDVAHGYQLRSYQGKRIEDIADATFCYWAGSAKQWQEWSARPELVPEFMRSLRFDATAKEPRAVWNGGSFQLVPEVARPSEKPYLVVYPDFQDVAKDSVRLGIGAVGITPDATGAKFAMAMRVSPPQADFSPEITQEWRSRLDGRAPFDGTSLDQGNGKRLSMKPVPASLKAARADASGSTPVWMASILLDGAPRQGQLDKALKKTLQAIAVPKESAIIR